jgi:hypothetical protein
MENNGEQSLRGKTASVSDNNRRRGGTAVPGSFGHRLQMPWMFAQKEQSIIAAELK